MLIKACSVITRISDDAEVNAENYMEGIGFISNLYNFMNALKLAVPLKQVEFLPHLKVNIRLKNWVSRQQTKRTR